MGVEYVITEVFVALLGEGTPVWRPVQARLVGNGVYELVGPMVADEVWEFQPGQVVECEQHSFSPGLAGLVARRPTTA